MLFYAPQSHNHQEYLSKYINKRVELKLFKSLNSGKNTVNKQQMYLLYIFGFPVKVCSSTQIISSKTLKQSLTKYYTLITIKIKF